MTEYPSDRTWEVPEGASPIAPGEEIVFQVHPSYWRLWPVSWIFVPLFCIGGIAMVVSTLLDPHHPDYKILLIIALCMTGMGLLVLWSARRHCRITRLTATNRRVILETLGSPRKTREIRYSPTVAVTHFSVNGFEQLIVEGDGRKITVSALPKTSEVAEAVAGLRELCAREAPVTAIETAAVVEPASPEEELQLADDETVLMRVRPHLKAVGAMRGAAVLLVLSVLCTLAFLNVRGTPRYVFLLIGVVTAGGAVLVFCGSVRYCRHTLLTVTNRRIVLRSGGPRVGVRELDISPDLTLDWQRNVKYPRIIITSPEGGLEIHALPESDKLITLLATLAEREMPSAPA